MNDWLELGPGCLPLERASRARDLGYVYRSAVIARAHGHSSPAVLEPKYVIFCELVKAFPHNGDGRSVPLLGVVIKSFGLGQLVAVGPSLKNRRPGRLAWQKREFALCLTGRPGSAGGAAGSRAPGEGERQCQNHAHASSEA